MLHGRWRLPCPSPDSAPPAAMWPRSSHWPETAWGSKDEIESLMSKWPTAKVVMASAWASDLAWAAMVWLGYPAVTKTGIGGFVVSTFVFFIAKAKYDRQKPARLASGRRGSNAAK